MKNDLLVRPLRQGDVESIINIDARVTGEKRAGFWRGHLSAYLAAGEPTAESLIPELCQVAERGGRVVGFVVGDVQPWQFGLPRSGRVVAVGVDPDSRRSGVGRAVVAGLLEQFGKMGLGAVRCVVSPGDELEAFFERCGFGPSGLQIRSLKLGS